MKKNQETGLYESRYWHPAVTTDAVVFGYDVEQESLEVLLIQRGKAKPGEQGVYEGCWALPGGFMREDDANTESCMLRELCEETCLTFADGQGLQPEFVEELGVYSDKDRDPRERVITVAYYALVKKDRYRIQGGDDAAEARWFSVAEISELELAFDHKTIISRALETLRSRIHFVPIGFHLLDETFTMPQLMSVYTAILGPEKEFDRANFRKKILAMGYVEDTSERDTGHPHRSAFKYRFVKDRYEAVKKLGSRLEF